MHKTILLAALLGLLPTVSHATCAWVLWENLGTIDPLGPKNELSVRFDPAQWSPREAFQTLQACGTFLERLDAAARTELRDARTPGGTRALYPLFRCLPDRIDPRRQ